MDKDLAEFAQLFHRFIEHMSEAAESSASSPVRDVVEEHLALDSASLPVIAESFPSYDHVNIHLAMSAYLRRDGRSHRLVGLTGHQRHFSSMSDLIQTGHRMGIGLASADFVNLATSPDETVSCVQYGLFLVEEGNDRLAVLMRGPDERSDQSGVTLEVVCPDEGTARRLLDEVRRLVVELNVFRAQVIAFGESHMGRFGVGPVVFQRRPNLGRDRLVLEEGTLELIERQTLGVARQRDRLRASGQHVKRGLLLYGPPGNGKTLTVRYLMSKLREHTIVVLTGGGLQMVRTASAIARLLQPAVVVLEDVDLVAQERSMYPGANPLLFDVLNELDGIAGDADVAFVLTTNRPDLLEPALAARPGRVDLAVEIGLPGDDARRRLIALYGGGLRLQLDPDISAGPRLPSVSSREGESRKRLSQAVGGSGRPLRDCLRH
ncbi:MAG: ATP-binding protein, partial [Actinobacteria bacterium]|nr:ATP-binding protein [Actinomycetota bacterium]